MPDGPAKGDSETVAHVGQGIDLSVIVPPGLDATIFPWGPHTLVDHVRHSVPAASGHVIDLRPALARSGIVEAHRETLRRAKTLLSEKSVDPCFGHTLNPYIFLGLLVSAGPDLPDIAARSGALSLAGRFARLFRQDRALSRHLDALRADHDAIVDAAIRTHAQDTNNRRRILGISVYDYLLVNALHIAGRIRAVDPDAIILFGGDYFDERTAEALADDLKRNGKTPIDAVVAGYGEQICGDLARALAAGIPFRDVRVPGLVPVPRTGGNAAVVVPEDYGTSSPRARYVRTDPAAAIRVLSQRGCSWGECTFCSQIDRRRFFTIDQRSLRQDLVGACEALTAKTVPPPPFHRISLDADENDPVTVLSLMNSIVASRPTAQPDADAPPARFLLEFWLMVRSFRADFLSAALKHRNHLICRVILNVESLGPETVKAMRKGFSPLQALEAVKALRDAGQMVSTNYFAGYPTQSPEDVAAEVALLERAIHLFTPPRTTFHAFPYAANGRDEIAAHQDRFHVAIERDPHDHWVRDLHGVDLPISIWSHRYRRTGRLGRGEWAARAYQRLARARTDLHRLEGAWMVLAGRGGTPPRGVLRRRQRAVAVARAWLWLAETVSGARVYSRRDDVIAAVQAMNQSGHASDAACPPTPDMILQESRLIRVDLQGRRTETPLGRDEVDVLRHCYWSRDEQELTRTLSRHAPETIRGIIDRHLTLGSLVRYRRSLLCVAHDPAFARNGAWETAPKRLRISVRSDVPVAGPAQPS